MKIEFFEYNCAEFFETYYSGGLFHPTEAQDLLPHNGVNLDNEKQELKIGQIWDDHDLILCYRKGREGIWGRSNYDGSYQLFSNTIKEFTEGWYQRESNYWGAMTQKQNWIEVAKYYQKQIKRYNWNDGQLLQFIEKGLLDTISNNLFIKGYKNYIGISLNNGFVSRPFENMVYLYYDKNNEDYIAHFHLNFFDAHSSESYKINQCDEMIENIKNWINKSA